MNPIQSVKRPEKSWKENLQLAGIILFVFTLPYTRELNQLCMGFFLITCAIAWDRQKWHRQRKSIFVFTLIYLVSVVSGIYSPDFHAAYSVLEIQSTLFLVPVLFASSYQPTVTKNNIIKLAFVSGVCTALCYLGIHFIYEMRHAHIPFSGWFQEEYLNHHYSAPIGIHASFLSSYVAVCLFFLINFLASFKQPVVKGLAIIMMLVCLVSLFVLASRMVMLMTLACLIFFVPYEILRWKWHARIIFGFAILAISLFLFSKNEYFQSRFTDNLEKDIKFYELISLYKKPDSAIEKTILKNDGSRIERWIAALKVIREKPWFGYGTGQEKPVLFKKYKEMGLTVTLEKQYDAHNQFLAFTIKSGLPGLIAFLMMLAYSFYTAIKGRDFTYFSFLFITTGICLIDNFLEVNKGIFFFSFFNIFFYLSVFYGINPVKEMVQAQINPLSPKKLPHQGP